MSITATYIGGPTALIEIAGLRLLTDPTFDPAPTEYPLAGYTLRKKAPPAIRASEIGTIDVVLLSHDHHVDNLDHAGRLLLQQAKHVFTTSAGADRLGAGTVGLQPWRTVTVPAGNGRELRITATPARHGPEGGDRGPVIGFVLSLQDSDAVYVSGDTVWFDGVQEVSRRFTIGLAILFMGAARVKEVGPAHLTFTAAEAMQAACAFEKARIIPLHYEGWEHFSETREDVTQTFSNEAMERRLLWLEPGQPTVVPLREQEAPSKRTTPPRSQNSVCG